MFAVVLGNALPCFVSVSVEHLPHLSSRQVLYQFLWGWLEEEVESMLRRLGAALHSLTGLTRLVLWFFPKDQNQTLAAELAALQQAQPELQIVRDGDPVCFRSRDAFWHRCNALSF